MQFECRIADSIDPSETEYSMDVLEHLFKKVYQIDNVEHTLDQTHKKYEALVAWTRDWLWALSISWFDKYTETKIAI